MTDKKHLAQMERHILQVESIVTKQATSIQPAMVILEEMSTSMAALSGILQASFNTPVLEVIANIAELYMNTITAALAPFTESIMESLKRLPEHVRKALIIFGEHGWYFDWGMQFPDIWNWESAFTECRVDEAEEALSSYFESRLDEIEAYIIKKFNHRKEIISDAFEAHRARKYSLSIPVFFAQTDGICKEIFDRCLFYRGKKAFNAETVEQITNDTILAALLGPLDERLPVVKKRHKVMHGESLSYGTRINGLKAISLINYVACVTEDE